ncbi:MAG: AraC family transcriptional regulator [Pseudomonadota bacterium]
MTSPVSKLFLPPPVLAGCIFASVYRDTRGAHLLERDRVNHFPASPLVSVTRVIHGTLTVLPFGLGGGYAASATMGPSLFVMGPKGVPVSSRSPGEVTAISLGLYYDAWLQLGGDPEFRHAPKSLVDALARFGDSADPERGWHILCAELEDVWEHRRPPGWPGTSRIADWAQATLTRAALAGPGRSLRSLERRLKRMSGQTRRSLNFYSAFENLHRIVSQDPDNQLTDIALASGYSDQSHMGRSVRRATGFTPARLNQAIQTEEPFWCYRLLGERF